MKGKISAILLCLLLATTFLACNSAMTPMQPTAGFQQTNLVSDILGNASHTTPLDNPRGIAFIPGQPFWIADNNHGTAKVFDASGAAAPPLVVGVPIPPGDTAPSRPTGIVFNPIPEDFRVFGNPAQFVFATEDGTISTWGSTNGAIPTSAFMTVDNSTGGAVYKGLAILTPDCCREFLALTDFSRGSVDTLGIQFDLLATGGPFTDPNLPPGYAPFNIQQIGTQVFVTYALQDAAKHDPVPGPGNGIVDLFDQTGVFIGRFASNGPLNAPWGVVQASSNFGPFSNDILIGNFGDGTINAFDPATGHFLGQLKDSTGKVIANPGLWAIVFRNDGVGDPNTLYFTAGLDNQKHGLFGSIIFHQ